jgi:hypothetical protein
MIVIVAAVAALVFVVLMRRDINRTLGRNRDYRNPLHPTGFGFDVAVLTLVWFIVWLVLTVLLKLASTLGVIA